MEHAVLETLFLIFALSVDSFAAGLAYGADRIRIPFACALLINGICAILPALSFLLGQTAGARIPGFVTSGISCAVLFFLAAGKLLNSTIKAWIQKSRPSRPALEFHLFSFRFLLQVFCDSTQADADISKTLSPRESAVLAFALSADGLAAGFGAGVSYVGPLRCIPALFLTGSFLLGMAATLLGCRLGNRVMEKSRTDLSWIGGVVLLALAFGKLYGIR